MPKVASTTLRLNKPKGRMPTLQFCRPAELRVDASYQRDVSGGASQALIRKIAQNWNWDLCQPLVVARRVDVIDRLFVIDGQHRLEAARLRGDIDQLPCVILSYGTAVEESAAFVELNQQRKPLSRIDVFKAAVLSGTGAAPMIAQAIADAGLTLTAMGDSKRWRPGMIANVGGIERAWARHGPEIARQALIGLARGFEGMVLSYAGTIFPGIVAICVNEMRGGRDFEPSQFQRMVNMLSLRSQEEWRREVALQRADDPNLQFSAASARAFLLAWEKARMGARVPAVEASPAAPKPLPVRPVQFAACSPKASIGAEALAPKWCDQCQLRVSPLKASSCGSRFCSLKRRA